MTLLVESITPCNFLGAVAEAYFAQIDADTINRFVLGSSWIAGVQLCAAYGLELGP